MSLNADQFDDLELPLSVDEIREQLECALGPDAQAGCSSTVQKALTAEIYLSHVGLLRRFDARFGEAFMHAEDKAYWQDDLDPQLERVRRATFALLNKSGETTAEPPAAPCPRMLRLRRQLLDLDREFGAQVYDPALKPAQNDLRGTKYLNLREQICRMIEEDVSRQAGDPAAKHEAVRSSTNAQIANVITCKAAQFRIPLIGDLQRQLEAGELIPGATKLPPIPDPRARRKSSGNERTTRVKGGRRKKPTGG